MRKMPTEIGKILRISHRTVEWHVQAAMQKLSAKTRTQGVIGSVRKHPRDIANGTARLGSEHTWQVPAEAEAAQRLLEVRQTAAAEPPAEGLRTGVAELLVEVPRTGVAELPVQVLRAAAELLAETARNVLAARL